MMSTMGRGEAPIAAAETPAKESDSSRDRKTGPKEQVRVLVVDDDYDIRETLRILLEDEGYLVDEATNGRMCLELVRSASAPYVVLLDLMMPQLGGAAVLGIISQNEALAHRHAVLLVTASTYTAEEMLGEVLQRLQIPLIRKPFDLDLLVSQVEIAARRIVPDADSTTS
ncbi:MAG: two-component system response regulator [Ktedonobacterales bacterium]